MSGFTLFLEFFTFLLSVASIALVYMAVDQCRESAFVPIYYFIGMALGAAMILSLARLGGQLMSGFPLSSRLAQDLFISYIVLFLFGSLWQSYEASLCVPKFLSEDS